MIEPGVLSNKSKENQMNHDAFRASLGVFSVNPNQRIETRPLQFQQQQHQQHQQHQQLQHQHQHQQHQMVSPFLQSPFLVPQQQPRPMYTESPFQTSSYLPYHGGNLNFCLNNNGFISPFDTRPLPVIPPPPVLDIDFLPELPFSTFDNPPDPSVYYNTFQNLVKTPVSPMQAIPPPPKPAPPPTSALEIAIAQLVDSTGGLLKLEMVSKLIKLMHNEKTPEGRSILLTVMHSSRPMFQKQFVAEGGLDICNTWLTENKSKLGRILLKLLLILPVDFSDLKSNGKIGKTVKKIANSSEPKLQILAKKLLNNWMQTVERATPKKRAAPTATITAATPPKKVAKIKKTTTITSSNAFALSENPKQPSKATKIVVKKPPRKPNKLNNERKVELINEAVVNNSQIPSTTQPIPTSNKRASEGPLSADDIKKKKLTQKKDIKPMNGTSGIAVTALNKGNQQQQSTSSGKIATATVDNANKTQIVNDNVNNTSPSKVQSDNQPKKPKKKVTWPPDHLLTKVKRFKRDKTLSSSWNKTPPINKNTTPGSPQAPVATNNNNMNNNMNNSNNMNSNIMHNNGINTNKAGVNGNMNHQQRNGNNNSASTVQSPRLSVSFRNSIQWYRPHRLELPSEIKIGVGINSKERYIQQQREQFIPAANFQSGKLPETPIESEERVLTDDEINEYEPNIPIIPLVDLSKYEEQQNNNLNSSFNNDLGNNRNNNLQPSYSSPAPPVQSAPSPISNLDPLLLQSLLNKSSVQQVLSILTNKSLNGNYQQPSPIQNQATPNYNVPYTQNQYTTMNQVSNNAGTPYQHTTYPQNQNY